MNFFIKNLKYVIIIVFALSIYIQDWDVKNNKEPRWRDGVAHFICNQEKCTIEVFDKNNNKIARINSISPSSTSDVAYLSHLMRMDYDLEDYENFLEIHPSTDTTYKIIKNNNSKCDR